MFQRLYELSMILPKKVTWEKLNEGMPPEYNQGFALCFDEQGCWFGVQTFQKTGKDVIYRSGPSNGTDFTPCCKLATSTGERILRAVEALENGFTGTEAERQWLKTTIENYKQHQTTILEELEKAKTHANLNLKDSRGFVLWAKFSSGYISPVYEWDTAKQFLEQQFSESLAKKGGKRSGGTCMISGKINQEVYGGFSDIACYNLDKRGSIAGGFVENLAHRNFPISEEVAIDIAYAFAYAQAHLQGMMAGQTYLILPYTVNLEVREQFYDRLTAHPERFQLGKVQDLLVADEWELVDEFGNLGDQMAFFLVFYEENQASWRIQAEVQELLPSRLHRLQEKRREIEKLPDLISIKEGEEKPLTISANTFKHFIGGTKEQSTNTLRTWLVALFEGKTIDYHHFLHHLVDKIVATGKKNPEYFHHTIREAFGLYRYTLLTGFIQLKETIMDLPNFDSVYGRYIHEHRDFFTRPEIITAFLSGCYVSTMTNVQYQKRGATPFTKKFIGRLLNRETLKRLYREAHDKLMQYDSLGIVLKGLDPDLTQSWVACGQSWNISDEETTFAFTIGYSLRYRISQLYKDSTTETIEETEE